ncbi:hypothetical protein ACFLIM_42440 [Nonomuraea sp. M3C6]|uniref:DUF4386 family protein n=1 Tax=Nonomuraea marmarensis TaxID=3351344 RepID=A0ABW7AR09_9ACTN
MTEHRLYLKTAAICLIVGSVTAFVSRLAHGDLPAADPEAALRFIASHPFYAGVHLGALVGVVIAAAGFVALAGTLQQPAAVLLGRLGTASALVGSAVFATDFATDGRAGQTLAEAWQGASPTGQADLVDAARTVFTALQGPSVIAISLLWGLPLVLFGRALALAGYPTWLGWSGMVVGAVTFAAALAQFLRPSLFPGVLLYGLLVSLALLWGAALGIALWYRARHVGAVSGTPPAAAAA